MRPLALFGLTLTLALPLAGCGDTWWNPPFTGGYSPHVPAVDSDNMRRVMGLDTPTAALQTEPGNVWPGPVPPGPTLSDRTEMGAQPLPGPLAPRPDTPPPLPNVPAHPRVTVAPTPAAPPPSSAPVVVPNGNGTSTVIHPDGRIETIQTPK